MADKTGIEWTDATWNPVTGCDRVSPGCAHCYALELAGRLKLMGSPGYQRDGDRRSSGPGFAVTLHPDRLDQPLRWTKPRMVFVNSMSDLFHEEIPDSYIAEVFGVMAAVGRHTFQVLTKRPERMQRVLNSEDFWETVDALCRSRGSTSPVRRSTLALPNVWLGVSIENRRFVERAELLRNTPAAVRFISAEPLLGPLVNPCPVCHGGGGCSFCDSAPGLDFAGIDWLIVGGESGPRHRPIKEEWVVELLDACGAPGSPVAFFFKQWGGPRPTSGGRELDGRTWDEMPAGRAT